MTGKPTRGRRQIQLLNHVVGNGNNDYGMHLWRGRQKTDGHECNKQKRLVSEWLCEWV